MISKSDSWSHVLLLFIILDLYFVSKILEMFSSDQFSFMFSWKSFKMTLIYRLISIKKTYIPWLNKYVDTYVLKWYQLKYEEGKTFYSSDSPLNHKVLIADRGSCLNKASLLHDPGVRAT